MADNTRLGTLNKPYIFVSGERWPSAYARRESFGRTWERRPGTSGETADEERRYVDTLSMSIHCMSGACRRNGGLATLLTVTSLDNPGCIVYARQNGAAVSTGPEIFYGTWQVESINIDDQHDMTSIVRLTCKQVGEWEPVT